MNLLAIDPGTEESAILCWDGKTVGFRATLPNDAVLEYLGPAEECIVIEGINCYGMPIGRETIQTCYWIGRYYQRALDRSVCVKVVSRQEIKLHHCGSARAKDSNIRQVLLDKYGAQGTKKEPGVTYGLSKHLWSAFAIATWYTETKQPQPQTIPY